MKHLLDLRPCDNCRGPLGLLFQVVRTSLAVVNATAVHQFVGMHRFFGAKASESLVECFAPAAMDAVTVAGDEHPELMTELVLCQGCFNLTALDLPMLAERVHERAKAVRDRESGASSSASTTASDASS